MPTMMSGPVPEYDDSEQGVTLMNSETRVLATYVADLQFSDLPEDVVARTRLLVMDHVGIALRARLAADLNESMAAAIQVILRKDARTLTDLFIPS